MYFFVEVSRQSYGHRIGTHKVMQNIGLPLPRHPSPIISTVLIIYGTAIDKIFLPL
jgi:hypothetical protein